MADHFYTVEILNLSFEANGNVYSNSVRLQEFLGQKKIAERRLGLIDRHEIYSQIKAGSELNLDNAYIKDFSISEYKQKLEIPPHEKLIISGISAQNAFFDCDSVIDFSYLNFQEQITFKETVFSHGMLTFAHSDFNADEIDFSACRFHSHLTTFENADFNSTNLIFESSKISGESISFVNASFNCNEVNFKRVNFGTAKVKFQFAEFGTGNKLFERIKANGSVFDFRRVIFGSGKIDFRRSMLNCGFISFEESEIKDGKLTFRMSKFSGGDLSFRRMEFGKDEANFDHIDFGNRNISFESAHASVISISNSSVHANLDLRIKHADKIDLCHTYLYAITDLNFLKKDALEKLSILGIRNLGKIIIRWKENNVRALIENAGGTSEEIADQFNSLKDNFSNNGQYNDEDEAYVYFKRFEHKHNREAALQKYTVLRPLIQVQYALRSLVFDKMGLYATNPNRVLLSMIVAIFSFAGIYILFSLFGIGEIVNSVDASDKLDIFDKSLYHSAITFFTIGYGDFYPTSFNRMISAFEGWTGVFMMSYFTVAFVRKILR